MYWFYIPYALVIIFGIIRTPKFNYKILLLLLFIIAYSLLTYQYGLTLVVKQLVNILFSALAFYYYLTLEDFNLESIFRKYILISKVVLLLGYLQVFLFTIGYGHFFTTIFPFLRNTNISFRFQSITAEPSFLTLGLVPVVFFSLNTLFYERLPYINKKWSILFVLGFLLTFATTAYFALLLMLLILYCKNLSYQKVLFAGVAFALIFFLAWSAYTTIPLIKVRVDDSVRGFTSNLTENDGYKTLNISTYILVANAYITKESVKDNPLTGNGLGTHELTYDKYLASELRQYSNLNRRDAGSMALRLLTETGIIGLFLFVLFTVKYKIRSRSTFNSREKFLWLLNSGVFILITLYLLRNGNYTVNGKILFLFLYYYSSVYFLNEKKYSHISNLNT